MPEYHGSCHCGAVKFSFKGEEIDKGLRCNCSMCRRKGALMTAYVIPEADLQIEAEPDQLGLYQFDTEIAKHYFCKSCGIYTHNETLRKPGHYRVNIGCLEAVDAFELESDLFDGKNLL